MLVALNHIKKVREAWEKYFLLKVLSYLVSGSIQVQGQINLNYSFLRSFFSLIKCFISLLKTNFSHVWNVESNNWWVSSSFPSPLEVVCFPRKSHSSLQENFSNGFSKKKNGLSLWTFISHSFWFGWKPIFFLMELREEGWDQAWEGLQACSWRWRRGGEVWKCLSSSLWGIGNLELGKSL